MAISVTKLRDKMTGGGARPSLFFANIDFSPVVGKLGDFVEEIVNKDEKKELSFFMKGAQIPDSTINPISINFLGREFKVPSTDRVFQDWTVTVLNDEDYRIRHVFEAWIEYMTPGKAIFATAPAFGTDPQDSIFCNMSVHQMAKGGGPVKHAESQQYLGSYFFKDAFPTSVTAIDLNWDQKDVIEEFTVTFAYQYWEKLPAGHTDLTEAIAKDPFNLTGESVSSWVNSMGGEQARSE